MKFQSTQSLCGPASVSNALKALGKDIDEKAVHKVIQKSGSYRPAVNGTTQDDIVTGASKWATVVRRGMVDRATAVDVLMHALLKGQVAIIGVDNSTHWISVIGHLHRRILVADPAHEELVLSLTESELLTRWVYHDEDTDSYLCEMVILEKKGR